MSTSDNQLPCDINTLRAGLWPAIYDTICKPVLLCVVYAVCWSIWAFAWAVHGVCKVLKTPGIICRASLKVIALVFEAAFWLVLNGVKLVLLVVATCLCFVALLQVGLLVAHIPGICELSNYIHGFDQGCAQVLPLFINDDLLTLKHTALGIFNSIIAVCFVVFAISGLILGSIAVLEYLCNKGRSQLARTQGIPTGSEQVQ